MQMHGKPRFNSMRLVMSVLRYALEPEQEYHVSEMMLLVNESKAGLILHPPFVGKNAQRLLDKLVKNGKITMVREGYYALKAPKPRGE